MRRKVGLFLVFGAVLPLAAASVAWACGVLATLTLDQKVAQPGQAIQATGKNYSTAAGASAVTIRLKNRTGAVLATTAAQAGGKINAAFPIPANLSPGWYTVMATQNTANGTPKSGTPGRTNIRIQGARSASAVAASPWSSSNPSGPSGSGAKVSSSGSGGQSFLPMALAVFLSLAMLAAGWTLVGRRNRTVAGSQLGV